MKIATRGPSWCAARLDRWFAPALLGIVLAAAAQAALVSARGDLDVDEPFMAAALARPDQLMTTFVHDNVPLAYVLLAAWTQVVGTSAFAFRSLSIAAFAIAVAVIGLAARRRCSAPAGLLAALFLACSAPLGIDHAASARPYALLMLVAALALWATFRADEHPSAGRGATPLVLVHLLGLFTHPIYVFVAVGSSLAGAISGQRRLRLAAAPLAAIVLYLASWGHVLRQTLALPTISWMARPTIDDLVAGYTVMWGGRNAFVFAGMVIALLAVRGVRVRRLVGRHTATALLIALFALGGAFVASQVKPVYIVMRTPVIALPAASVALSGLLVPLGTPVLLVTVSLLLMSSAGRYTTERWRAPDPAPTRASLAAVAARARCGDTVVATGLSYGPVTYFAAAAGMPACVRVVAFPPDVPLHPGWLDRSPGFLARVEAIAPAVAVEIPATGTAWVFLTRRGITSEEGKAFVDAFETRWTRTETLNLRGTFFDEVQVFEPDP